MYVSFGVRGAEDNDPREHTTLKQCCFNVDSTLRCDVESTLN